MRCTRCDRLVIPQAVGLTPEGDLVFGWCLACLEETGCTEIEVASPSKAVGTQLSVPRRAPRWVAKQQERKRARARARALERAEPHILQPIAKRRRVVAALAGLMGIWGLVLVSAGITLRGRRGPEVFSPFGNGTPALLIGGGAATALVGLTLWAYGSLAAVVRSISALRMIQGIAFLAALGILLEGIVNRYPQRDAVVVALAGLAVIVAIAARMVELRHAHGTSIRQARAPEPGSLYDDA
jgi:hypothetical protein